MMIAVRLARHAIAPSACTVAAVALLACSGAAAEEFRYGFRLKKGTDLPVCRAYVRQLEETHFVKPIQCGRPMQNAALGFQPVTRERLPTATVRALLQRVEGFWRDANQDHWEYINAMRRDPPDPYESTQDALWRSDSAPAVAWRFNPQIDIDNDGTSDNVVLWQGIGLSSDEPDACGRGFGAENWPYYSPRFLMTLESDGLRIQVFKTIRRFGHPVSYAMVIRKSDARPNGIRPAVEFPDVFKFDGRLYFDGFYDQYGGFDIATKPSGEGESTLAVLSSEKRMPRVICEVVVTSNVHVKLR